MNILVFDTETAGSFNKPFCYNIGYVIANTETKEILLKKDFVVEQIWHNLPLFDSAYYADKRPLYIASMRAKKTKLEKFGYIMREMARDIKAYQVENAYAFNSSFDINVFEYGCNWFKCINPLETINVFDIRAFAIQYLVNEDYKAFCDKHEFYTETGNYSTTAENVYRYITKDTEFLEDHTALSDSLIETEILFACTNDTEILQTEYKVPKAITREFTKTLEIVKDKETVFEIDYNTMRVNKDKTKITLK